MISLLKIAHWIGIKDVPYLPISLFVQDSRLAQKGALFFALQGETSDGLNFLSDVAKKGAFAAVVPKSYKGPSFGLALLYVDDVLQSMHDIARCALKERSTKVVGVTGSVGKTTTRHFLTQLLEIQYKVAFPPKNYNSQRTMPLVILNARGDEDFIVLEMAMDLPGEIGKLVSVAPTDYAILTPVVLAHYFGDGSPFETLNEVAKEKAMIFCDQTEFAVINIDSALFPEVREACMCEHVVYPTHLDFEFPFKESHLCESLSGAIEMALHLGISERKIKEKLPSLKTVERRFEKVIKKGITFINDAYNASPRSSVAAFRNLPLPSKGKKKIAVFGSMGGLGPFALGAHMQVAREALNNVDELLCLGSDCRPMVDMFLHANKPVELFETIEALKEAIKIKAKEGDVVLVKGSNSHKLWEVIPE